MCPLLTTFSLLWTNLCELKSLAAGALVRFGMNKLKKSILIGSETLTVKVIAIAGPAIAGPHINVEVKNIKSDGCVGYTQFIFLRTGMQS